MKLSTTVRNAMLDAIETAVGASAIIKIRTGAAPAAIGDASTGTVLSTINLPSDYLAAAASGVKSKIGTWEDASADATGTAGHFELCASDGTTVHARGDITNTAGAGPMKLNNLSIASGQPVTVVSFALTAGNA